MSSHKAVALSRPANLTRLAEVVSHAASAVEGGAAIAMAAMATIPRLGFIHEDSGQSLVLDVAGLFRDTVTVPCAFKAALVVQRRPGDSIERVTRRPVAERLRRDGVIRLWQRPSQGGQAVSALRHYIVP